MINKKTITERIIEQIGKKMYNNILFMQDIKELCDDNITNDELLTVRKARTIEIYENLLKVMEEMNNKDFDLMIETYILIEKLKDE